MLKNIYCLKCVFFTNVKRTNILNMSLALFAVCKGARWGPSLWRTHGEIPFHWLHWFDDDWWWWWPWWLMMVIFVIQVTVDNLLLPPQNSLMAALSRWILTNHVLSTCHFRSAISLCKLFPCRCKGWVVFFPHCLKNDIFTVYFLFCAASQLRISKKFSHRDHMEFARLIEFAGVDKELRCRLYWDCQWWARWSKWLQCCCYDCEWRSGWPW